MKNIKPIYWIFTGLFALLTVFFTVLSNQDGRPSIILSGVALITSSIALGLSDKKINSFKGKVAVWSVRLDPQNEADENSQYRVSIKILNEASEPVYNAVYRLRLPSRISRRLELKNSNALEYRHGKSMIIVDDTYGFIAAAGADGFIPIDFKMQLRRCKEIDVYLTVSGSNIKPTTFKITQKEKEIVINATSDKPLIANKA